MKESELDKRNARADRDRRHGHGRDAEGDNIYLGAYGLYDRVLGGFYQNQLPGGAFVGPPPAVAQ